MVNTFRVKISLPNKACIDKDCVSVNMPTALGYVTLLHDHSQIIGSVKPGYLTITLENGTKYVGLINYGVYHFNKNKLVILSDFFEKAEDINVDAIQAIKNKLQQAMANENIDKNVASKLNSFTKLITLKAKATNNKKE